MQIAVTVPILSSNPIHRLPFGIVRLHTEAMVCRLLIDALAQQLLYFLIRRAAAQSHAHINMCGIAQARLELSGAFAHLCPIY